MFWMIRFPKHGSNGILSYLPYGLSQSQTTETGIGAGAVDVVHHLLSNAPKEDLPLPLLAQAVASHSRFLCCQCVTCCSAKERSSEATKSGEEKQRTRMHTAEQQGQGSMVLLLIRLVEHPYAILSRWTFGFLKVWGWSFLHTSMLLVPLCVLWFAGSQAASMLLVRKISGRCVWFYLRCEWMLYLTFEMKENVGRELCWCFHQHDISAHQHTPTTAWVQAAGCRMVAANKPCVRQ